MDANNAFINQAGAAFLVVHAMEWAKRKDWLPWITRHTDTLNKVLGILAAIATSVGITCVSSWHIESGGVITVTIPPLSTVLHTAAQLCIQQTYYHGVVKKA